MMEFEKFRGRAMYYVTDYSDKVIDRVEAINAVAKMTKMKRGLYLVIPVWIRWNVSDPEDHGDLYHKLYLEPVKGADKMMAVVRKEAIR